LANINKRLAFVCKVGKEGLAFVWSGPDDNGDNLDPVGRVVVLLAVGLEFVKGAHFGKGGDDLGRNVGTEVDGKGNAGIGLLAEITKLFGHGEFVGFDPVLDELSLALGNNNLAELDGFGFVELGEFEHGREVVENRSWLAWHGWEPEELLDGELGTECWSACSKFGGIRIVAHLKKLIELLVHEVTRHLKTG